MIVYHLGPSRRSIRGIFKSARPLTIPLLRPRYISSTPNPLPATLYRGGTSKGIFLERKHLPQNPEEWAPIFRRIMGSPDPEYKRQLNGMGGGISSLSKIVVVGPTETNADCEYTFVQVGVDDGQLDFAGNCGNLSAMVGVFAVQEGMVDPEVREGILEHVDVSNGITRATVSCYNVNTKKIVTTTFPFQAGYPLLELNETSMDGVPGRGSEIALNFVNPAGARTGKLLPTGNAVDVLEVGEEDLTEVSLVDATNPTVILPAHEVRILLGRKPNQPIDYHDANTLDILNSVRNAGAIAMGLDPAAPSQPKIVIVGPSEDPSVHVEVKALSMGVLHKAIPMTAALCVGVAGAIKGTVVSRILKGRPADRLTLLHASGKVEVGSAFDDKGRLSSATAVRTGRTLMKGVVYW